MCSAECIPVPGRKDSKDQARSGKGDEARGPLKYPLGGWKSSGRGKEAACYGQTLSAVAAGGPGDACRHQMCVHPPTTGPKRQPGISGRKDAGLVRVGMPWLSS